MSTAAAVACALAGWFVVAIATAVVITRASHSTRRPSLDAHAADAMRIANTQPGRVVLSVRMPCGQTLAALSLFELEHAALVHAHECRGAR